MVFYPFKKSVNRYDSFMKESYLKSDTIICYRTIYNIIFLHFIPVPVFIHKISPFNCILLKYLYP